MPTGVEGNELDAVCRAKMQNRRSEWVRDKAVRLQIPVMTTWLGDESTHRLLTNNHVQHQPEFMGLVFFVASPLPLNQVPC